MQNRYHSCDETGYVVLNGGWNCPRCGCANDACDVCGACGWNRCGCQGGVVRMVSRGSACAASRDRSGDCEDCPASFITGHSVQCCPDNTRIRRDCGCTAQSACQTCSARENSGCTAQSACQTCSARENSGCTAQSASQTCSTRENSGCTAQSARQTRSRNAYVGVVHGVKQELEDVYESESALRTGTLFPELHNPLNGRCPGDSNCSTSEQQSAFAAWDLRLYLNTHPDDKEALALFRRLREEAQEPSYATTFLEDDCACGWDWTEGPWPWECQPCDD